MGRTSRRTCEICGLKEAHSKESLLFSGFPLDEDRCRQWLKVVGNAELVQLPVEKLHQIRHVCQKHFTMKDFNKKRSRLKRNAVPSLNLNAAPLSDDQLSEFPLHIFKSTGHADNKADKEITDVAKREVIAGPAKVASTVFTDNPESADIHDGEVITDGADDDADEQTEEQIFSWQRDSEINCDDFDMNPDNATAAVIQTEYDDTVEINSLEEATPETDIQALNNDKEDLHDGYKCDMCKGPIYRFRYSCVECANYDLCGACEARAAHSQHYLLRIPRPRPHGEIQLIMDTIRRFLTADLKSLRDEANFVNTLMDEMKSEVLSEAGSDPVPDEPDYPIVSEHSSDEHDCEMDESNDHTSVTQDDAQGVTNRDKDILQEWEFPNEIYNTKTIENHVDRDSHSRTNVQDEHVQHKPKRLIVNKIDRPSSSNTLGKVSKRILVTCPKIVSIGNAVLKHKPEGSLVNKIQSLSPSNTLRKVTKKIFVTCPKKHPMSTDVVKLKAKNDGDETQATIKTSQPSVQREVYIQVKRLSKEDLKSAAVRQINDNTT